MYDARVASKRVPVAHQKRVPLDFGTRPPGVAPGTLNVSPDAPPPTVDIHAYGPDGLTRITVEDPAEIGPLLEKWAVVWVNVVGLGDGSMLEKIAAEFGIHRLALEDVVNVFQRPKVEPYDDHLFVVARMVIDRQPLETEQVSLFVGERYVLSFQERPGDCFDLVRERLDVGNGRLRLAGASYLMYALLDAMIDDYFPVMEAYGEHVDSLEDELLAETHSPMARRIHGAKSELLGLRRVVWPYRDVVNTLIRDESTFITDETRLYLRDCYDHVVQIMEIVETYREVSSSLLDVYLSRASHRLNEVMKVLTVFAAIFIPLSFITGIYGMNFTNSPWNMPELDLPFGYPLVLLLMAGIAATLLAFFHRRGFIGSSRPPRPQDPDPGPSDREKS